MNCPKHPREKMTLLFTGWICDACEPPKQQYVVDRQTMMDWNEMLWLAITSSRIQMPEDKMPQFIAMDNNSSYRALHYAADVVLSFENRPMMKVQKNRYSSGGVLIADTVLFDKLYPFSHEFLIDRLVGLMPGSTVAMYQHVLFLVARR